MIRPPCRRRTLTYIRPRRRRKRKAQANTRVTSNNQDVIFHYGPVELPVATVRPRETRARAIVMLVELERWLAARWSWLRPRTVPVIVASLGLLFVLASADYLAHAHGKVHPQPQLILR